MSQNQFPNPYRHAGDTGRPDHAGDPWRPA